jgi:serine/threonine-protein kinase
MDPDALGVCPSCEAVGPVGERCASAACTRRGYCHIPGAHAVTTPGTLPDPLLGQKVESYLVVDLLGVGGFGRVYQALELPIRHAVALKLLGHEQLPEAVQRVLRERFEIEARALSSLHHPNIVQLLRYGLYYGRPFLVMELVSGGVLLTDELEARRGEGRAFTLDEVRDLVRQLLSGLAAAHAAGIIHRDIKPDNLMIQPVPGYDRLLRILDFGVAKFTDAGVESRLGAVGTPTYMAPEQFGSGIVGPASDLHAVAVLLFELLFDRSPFPGETVTELVARRLAPDFDPLAVLGEAPVPAIATAFFRRALARDPADRYATAGAFGEAFEAALAALEPLAVAPLSAPLPGADPAPRVEVGAPAAESDAAFRTWLQREADRLAASGERLQRVTATLRAQRPRRDPGPGQR